MSDYTQLTNFTVKDTLPDNDPNKIVLGADYDLEYGAIETAIATKANKVSGGTDGNLVSRDANGDIQDSGLSTAMAQNSWVEVASLSAPQVLSSPWQVDAISSAYGIYRLVFTWIMTAGSTIKAQFTASGTPDTANNYARYQSLEAMTGTPGPTVTGSTGVDNFFDSSQIGAGPFAGFAELTIYQRFDNDAVLWVVGDAVGSNASLTLKQQYSGTDIDGIQISADVNATLQSAIVMGLRNS